MNLNKVRDFFSLVGLLLVFNGVCTTVILLASPTSFTTFNCQRIKPNQGNCELTTFTGPFNKKQLRAFPVKELKSASLESYSYSSKKTYYYTLLKTENGKIPLPTGFYGPSGNTASLPAEINEFIKDPNQTSIVAQEDDSRGESYWVAGLIIGLANLIIINSIIVRMKAPRNE
ncbi:hypothetical protein H6F77_24690 [Microcoleus sp. FACHB-831]|nr:hypothetical protein [Microcoleus sp. FACHB-831]